MKAILQAIAVFAILTISVNSASSKPHVGPPAAEDVFQHTIIIFDSAAQAPIELARVTLSVDGRLVQGHLSDVNGRALFRDIPEGSYMLDVRAVGYVEIKSTIVINAAHPLDSIPLREVAQQEILITAGVIPNISVDTRTGNQEFDATTYHAPPQARITALVQQSVAGAVRAPTGEVHVRGQHGEFTYYIDGVPIPLGVFGGLNEVVDPKVIDHVTFLTGGFPAEYGGQMAAVMDVQTHVPSGKFHLDASTYAGSYLVFNGTKLFTPGSEQTASSPGDTLGNRVGPYRAINSNGQSLAISDQAGKLGFYLSGSRQETDRRIDPPVERLFHDHGFDYFLYGKANYLIDPTQILTLNLNWGKTVTQIPYDSLEGITVDDQTTTNAFQTLSYMKSFSTEVDHEKSLLVGIYAREGGLIFSPGLQDSARFHFANDTNGYRLAEDRSFLTLGTRVKYDYRLTHQTKLSTGFTFSSTKGNEQFTTTKAMLNAGPSLGESFVGSDFGLFVQAEQELAEWTSIDAGLRYDQHIAPDIPFTSQLSPRIRWNFFIDEYNTAYLYYGRLFMPNNIEGLRSIAATVQSAGEGALPERDHFFEGVYTRNWGSGVTSKLAGFYKIATPGVDDATLGSSAIKTPVNIDTVKTSGIELALTYSAASTPLSAYANAAIIHAYGLGKITGGFLGTDSIGLTDLDHDQRLSVVLGINYQPTDWFLNANAIYGSGLTNGNPSGQAYKAGLFDFNQIAHTTPSWIVDISGGYTFTLAGGSTISPSLYVSNLFDNSHLIKGAYFSNAAWEERRNVVLRVDYHL